MPALLSPSNLLDQGATLFNLLGGFFSQYGGAATILAYTRGLNEANLQTLQDTQELSSSVGRVQCPVFHRYRYKPLVINQSARLPDVRLTYNSDDLLGQSADRFLSGRTFDWSLPNTFVDVAYIIDQLPEPNVILTKGIDYEIDLGEPAIRFLADPFNTKGIIPLPIYDSSNLVVDQQVKLLLVQADYDFSYLSQNFGYVVRLLLNSSNNYKTLINAIWDAELLGPSYDALNRAMSAICDVPICITDKEVVKAIALEGNRQLIITSQNVYQCTLAATILVTVGQILNIGDQLTDAFQIIELSQGTPLPSVLSALTVPLNYLHGAFIGGLTWNNANTPLIVTTVSGRTYVKWALGGISSDVTLFFDTAHANGIMPGNKTLAQLLDTRPPGQQIGDPDANSLPKFINPLDFLVRNILRYGMTIIRTKQASFGPNALGMGLFDRVTRWITAPQGSIFNIQI